MTTEITVFRDLMLCSLVDMSRRFGRICCLYQNGQFRWWSLAGFSEFVSTCVPDCTVSHLL